MNPEERCKCGHERKWHNACSKCPCPFFLAGSHPPAVVREWKAAGRERRKAEGL